MNRTCRAHPRARETAAVLAGWCTLTAAVAINACVRAGTYTRIDFLVADSWPTPLAEHKERDKEAAKAASAEREKESAKAAADRDKASSKNGKAAGGGPKATSAAGKAGVAAAKVTKASQPQPKKAGLLPPKAAGPAKDVRESAGGKAGAKKAENGRAQGPSPVNGGVGGRRSPARFLEKNSDGGMTGGTKEATGRKSPASLVSPRAGNANADGAGDDRKGSLSQELDKERGVSTTSDVDTPKVRCCDPAARKLD